MSDFLVRGDFTSHAGLKLPWKIECDALTDEEIETFALIISKRVKFKTVFGIPRGGIRIANTLEKYADPDGQDHLIVDDVYTTGTSMKQAAADFHKANPKFYNGRRSVVGYVLFARNPIGLYDGWINPVFQMT